MLRKKMIAVVAMAAMLLTLLPVAAFAAVSIDVYGYNTSDEDVMVFYNDVENGDRYMIFVGEDYNNAIIGSFPNSTGNLRLSKSDYPMLKDDGYTKGLTVRVYDSEFAKQLASKTVKMTRTSNVPVTLDITDALLSKGGENQDIYVVFDDNYEPGFNDRLVFTALDANGNVLTDGRFTRNITDAVLVDVDEGREVRTFVDPPRNAETYRVEFQSAGRTIEALTQTIEVGDYFGKPRRLTMDYGDNKIYLGEKVTPSVYIVDDEGNTRDVAKLATYVYAGDAVDTATREYGGFTVKDDSRYVGTRVTVTAVYNGLSTSQTLDVVDQVSGISLNPKSGEEGKVNSVNFQLVDSNGQAAKLDWQPTTATVSFKNVNEPAAVLSGEVRNMNDIDVNGNGTLELSSSKPAKADVIITFKDNANRTYELNAGTYEFTAKPVEEMMIVMGINSNKMMINGVVKTIDTVPVIKNDRTFVPLRALSEGFGATVDFLEVNQSVTVRLDGKIVIMSVGQKAFTVDGKAADASGKAYAMDVEPYIDGNNRTMVPVRFVAEALGFQVEAIANADGTTANVVFTNNK